MITWLAKLFHAIADGLESEKAAAARGDALPTSIVFVENLHIDNTGKTPTTATNITVAEPKHPSAPSSSFRAKIGHRR